MQPKRPPNEGGDDDDLRHGVAIAPTMQGHQQPVFQDLLAWIFWEFQHVDAEKKDKRGH